MIWVKFIEAQKEKAIEELRDKIKNSVDKCSDQFEITEEQKKKFRRWEIADKPSNYCYAACIAKALGIMDINNKVDKDAAKIQLKPIRDKINASGDSRAQSLLITFDTCVLRHTGDPDDCIAMKNFVHCIDGNRNHNLLF